MSIKLAASKAPELMFGLVAPIGVDLDLVSSVLDQTIREMGYSVERFRLTALMREVPTGIPIADSPYIKSYRDRIAYANEVRRLLADDALAALAISAIRSFRAEERARRANPAADHDRAQLSQKAIDIPDTDQSDEEAPLPNQAYIIRQIKRPEEVSLFKGVYGKQFILVSAFVPVDARQRRIQELEVRSRGGLISEVKAKNIANDLLAQDAKEHTDEHGQNLRDAFPLGDVFIDATSRSRCEMMVRRFVNLMFGNNEVTPTHDEYGMYAAKSASLRSSDLSRQVGAAIFHASGEVVSMGCNEVPKTGGGTYWSNDPYDGRDFVKGHDPNELRKIELVVDMINHLQKGRYLSSELMELIEPTEICKKLLSKDNEFSLSESKIMDLLEFDRIIHAEMSAICDAARKGQAIQETTLYCTTFPCHICAKHIVASGIRRVVYLEPYPKSYANDLHSDSIVVDPDSYTEKVSFEAFIGVSPYRYRDLFEKGKRKYTAIVSRGVV